MIVSGRLIVHSNDSNYVPVSSWLLNVTVYVAIKLYDDNHPRHSPHPQEFKFNFTSNVIVGVLRYVI